MKSNLHPAAALRGYVRPAPVTGAEHCKANTVPNGAPGAHEVDANLDAGARELCVRRYQTHSKSAQGSVTDMHADHRASGQEEGQQVAQIELVVDGRHQ